jgi:hypothetical protein
VRSTDPPRELPEPLTEYFRVWESFDFIGLRRLFAPHAIYEILGRHTFAGIDSIEAYWRRNAVEQRDVSWSVSRSIAWDANIVAVWQAAFRRLGEPYELQGILWLRCENRRIVQLTEAYIRSITPS